MKSKKYDQFYVLLDKKFRQYVKNEREKLQKHGVKFSYTQCFQKLENDLEEKGKTANQIAKQKNMYKGRFIANYVLQYINKLKEMI